MALYKLPNYVSIVIHVYQYLCQKAHVVYLWCLLWVFNLIFKVLKKFVVAYYFCQGQWDVFEWKWVMVFFQGDFYLYDIESSKWTLITDDTSAMSGPGLIFDHQMAIDVEKQTIYVFGGRLLSWSANFCFVIKLWHYINLIATEHSVAHLFSCVFPRLPIL